MTDQVPSTQLSNSTAVGRLYGQITDDECMFDVCTYPDGRAALQIRIRGEEREPLVMPPGTHLPVQLFEQPDVLWLAHAVMMNGDTPMIIYAPIEPLESADGRCEMPDLAVATLEQVDEGVQDAMEARVRTWGEDFWSHRVQTDPLVPLWCKTHKGFRDEADPECCRSNESSEPCSFVNSPNT